VGAAPVVADVAAVGVVVVAVAAAAAAVGVVAAAAVVVAVAFVAVTNSKELVVEVEQQILEQALLVFVGVVGSD